MAKKSRGKRRLDKFYNLAKEQGYRSRAAFKLIQLDRKYNILGKARCVVDLCAAPGGWCQVARKAVPVSGMVVGVDLEKIRPIRGVTTLVEDITTERCRAALKRETQGGLVDVVLHDGAPNVGGNWASEAYSQSSLVLDSLRLATEFLVPNGSFVTKVFRSSEYTHLLYAMNQLFRRVEATKPQASRNTSAEIFVVCLGFKAPGKIDPRLLDAKHLFADVHEGQLTGVNVLRPSKSKAPREGYEHGASLVYSAKSVTDFVHSDRPVEMLGTTSVLYFGNAENTENTTATTKTKEKETQDKMEAHEATTSEIKELCADLKVLGKREFKELLRWRLKLRKAFGVEDDKDAAHGSRQEKEQGDDEGEEEETEESILEKMREIREYLERREHQSAKRRKKQKHKMRREAAIRAKTFGSGIAGKAESSEAVVDDDGLFSLQTIAKQRDLQALHGDGEMPSDIENLDKDSDDDSDNDGARARAEEAEEDQDEERDRYENFMEDYLDKLYDFYQDQRKKREIDAMGRVVRKKDIQSFHGRLEEDEAIEQERRLLVESEEQDGEDRDVEGDDDAAFDDDDEDDEDEEDEEDDEENKLVVRYDDNKDDADDDDFARQSSWFEQDLFKKINRDSSTAAMAATKKTTTTTTLERRRTRAVDKSGSSSSDGGSDDDDDDNDDDDDDDDDDDTTKGGELRGAKRTSTGAAGGGGVPSTVNKRTKIENGHASSRQSASSLYTTNGNDDADDDNDFEIVPSNRNGDISSDDDTSSSDDDDDTSSMDTQDKTETIAYAKKMLLSKRARQDILDNAYNKWNFHDTDLPRWFEADNAKYMRPIPPITKEEIEEAKAQFRAVDARTSKKVLEAKARKKRKMIKRMEAAKQRANSIAGQDDLSGGRKMREIAKLMAKARNPEAKKFEKGGGKKRKKDEKRGGPRKDARMRADTRGEKARAKRVKGKLGRSAARKFSSSSLSGKGKRAVPMKRSGSRRS